MPFASGITRQRGGGQATRFAYDVLANFEGVNGLDNRTKAAELSNTVPGDDDYRHRCGAILQAPGRANYRCIGRSDGVG
jgi:predicted chitinase